jgi:predicted nuclease of predicted toxin-antitoxin system
LRFKTDENLGGWLAAMLAEAGHDAATVAGQKLSGRPDPDIIGVCKAEGRALVTMDAEFGNPLIFDPRGYHGIVLIRVPDPIQPAVLRHAGQTLIAGLKGEHPGIPAKLSGKLWIVQPGRIRQYQHPEDPTPGFED